MPLAYWPKEETANAAECEGGSSNWNPIQCSLQIYSDIRDKYQHPALSWSIWAIVVVSIGVLQCTIHQYGLSIFHDLSFDGMPVVTMTDFVNGYKFYAYYQVCFCWHRTWAENKNVAFKMDWSDNAWNVSHTHSLGVWWGFHCISVCPHRLEFIYVWMISSFRGLLLHYIYIGWLKTPSSKIELANPKLAFNKLVEDYENSASMWLMEGR